MVKFATIVSMYIIAVSGVLFFVIIVWAIIYKIIDSVLKHFGLKWPVYWATIKDEDEYEDDIPTP